jgi:hypothetical protein
MAQQIINVGSGINDGTGDPLRTCFTKINQNFTEIYSRDAAGSNFDFTNNTLSTTNTNGDINLSPNGSGTVVVDDDKMRIKFSRTPNSAAGRVGDLPGTVIWDSNYIYVCVGNYDGSSHIWKRAAISGNW